MLRAQTPAEPATELAPVVTYGRSLALLGDATNSTEGVVGAAELAARPFLRRGELLEVVPGVIITQHSGSGKANQYFLRGFNLDHGTDFAVSVDGMPVNMRSHAHGQGYADLNFIIPELVQSVAYQKGVSFVENGDFSAAGAAQFSLVRSLPRAFAKTEIGEDAFLRFVAGGSFTRAGSTSARSTANTGATTTLGIEASYADGPWVEPEHGRRLNLFARHAWTAGDAELSLTLLGYRGDWDSTDQVPLRAIESGALDRFGAIDPTAGGDSDRASLSFDWARRDAAASSALRLYAIAYSLDLYSAFTYFLDDPVNGDQFNQRDRRVILGGDFIHAWSGDLAGRKAETTLGVQVRDDLIDVGLHKSRARARLSTTRQDDIHESSAGVFAKNVLHVTDAVRLETGLRVDGYRFDVDSDLAANSGTRTAAIASPKLNLIATVAPKTELSLSAGLGFHSNDARGTTITIDPADGVTPADRVDPFARAKGVELGLRTAALPGLVSTVSVWLLDLESELVFVGDGGATEPNGATRRFGVEWANFYHLNSWLALDADVALTHARYREDAGGGRHIGNSIATTVTGGAVADFSGGWTASLRARYFGPQPLIEDNSVIAPSSLTFNASVGWRGRDWEVALAVLNLLDRDNNDIAYFYESRLATESAGVEDIHLHPAEPRTLRLSITRRF